MSVISDNFNRADEVPLVNGPWYRAANWLYQMNLKSNQCSSGFGGGASYYNYSLGSADHFSLAVCGASFSAAAGHKPGLIVRSTGSSLQGYLVYYDSDYTQASQVFRYYSSGGADIGQFYCHASRNLQTNDILRFLGKSTATLEVYTNDDKRKTCTDSTYTGYYTGIGGDNHFNDIANSLDNWEADVGETPSGQPAVKRMAGVIFAARNMGVW